MIALRLAFLQSTILGIVQGITEFLPVSSSAHLIIIPVIFNFGDGVSGSLFFDVSLHFGTFLSVVLFFYKDWVKLVKAFFVSIKKVKAETKDEKMIWYLIFATIPAAVAGLIFEDTIDRLFHTGEFISIIYITIPLTLISFLMIFSEKNASQKKSTADITLKDALTIGIVQSFAIFPGVSRAAITICAGLLLGYTREESARFSFLLSTPIIFGAFMLKFIKSFNTINPNEISLYVTGTVTAAVVGFLSIKYLLKFLSKRRLDLFAYYRIALVVAMVTFWVSR